jgi:hypothetical protein
MEEKLYSTVFADNLAFIKNVTVRRIKTIKEFIQLLSLRADCEQQYADKMQRIGNFNLNAYQE